MKITYIFGSGLHSEFYCNQSLKIANLRYCFEIARDLVRETQVCWSSDDSMH